MVIIENCYNYMIPLVMFTIASYWNIKSLFILSTGKLLEIRDI